MIGRMKWLSFVVVAVMGVGCATGGGTQGSAPTAVGTQAVAAGPTVTVAPVPSSFALTGRMVWVDYKEGVVEYDPATGQLTPIFTPESGGIITAAALSPDGSQVA